MYIDTLVSEASLISPPPAEGTQPEAFFTLFGFIFTEKSTVIFLCKRVQPNRGNLHTHLHYCV